jgi:hypothetical protein
VAISMSRCVECRRSRRLSPYRVLEQSALGCHNDSLIVGENHKYVHCPTLKPYAARLLLRAY